MTGRERAWRWMRGATLIVFLGVVVAPQGPRADAAQRATPPSASGWPPWDPKWPPLPFSTWAPPRPMPDVLGAYAFAARHHDLLQYMPCYCGCARVGHRSNVDCYVKDGSPTGAPRWDLHGYS